MPQVTNHKARTPHSVVFDALVPIVLPQITLAFSQTNAMIALRFLLPTTTKIYRVMASVSGTVASTLSLNVVAGVAAEGTVGVPDSVDSGANAYPRVIAPAGTILFAADQAVSMVADTATQLDVLSDNFDVIFKGLMTIRTVTTGTTTGNLNITLLVKQSDINPPHPYGSIAVGGAAAEGLFLPSTSIP